MEWLVSGRIRTGLMGRKVSLASTEECRTLAVTSGHVWIGAGLPVVVDESKSISIKLSLHAGRFLGSKHTRNEASLLSRLILFRFIFSGLLSCVGCRRFSVS